MIFLLYHAFGCSLCLLVIQLTITAFLLNPIGSVPYHMVIGLPTMPVTMRSRAKLSTGSTTELSKMFLTGSISSQFSSRKSFTLPSLPVLSSSLSPSYLVRPSIDYHGSLFGDGDDVSVSNDGNFQISKFQLSDISKASFDSSTCTLPHNFGKTQHYQMEADCQEDSLANMALAKAVDITQQFAALSSQITTQSNNIKEQITRNDLKISSDFQWVVQANEEFKKDVCTELDDLHLLLTQQQNFSGASPSVPTTNGTSPIPSQVILNFTTFPSSTSTTMVPDVSTSSTGCSSNPNVQT
jgi:hypothetical protein